MALRMSAPGIDVALIVNDRSKRAVSGGSKRGSVSVQSLSLSESQLTPWEGRQMTGVVLDVRLGASDIEHLGRPPDIVRSIVTSKRRHDGSSCGEPLPSPYALDGLKKTRLWPECCCFLWLAPEARTGLYFYVDRDVCPIVVMMVQI